MKRFTFKKVFNSWVFFLIASVFFSSFSHAAGGKGSRIPDRTNVSSANYVAVMVAIGIVYATFLFLRSRRRRKYSQIVLKFGK
jgi:hypothetical protein